MSIVLQQSARVNEPQAAGTTDYYIAGSCARMQGNATEANRSIIIRTPGSASKMYISVTSNDLITPSTLTYRKNSADGSQAISIPAATTGRFQDAANFDSLLSGDLVGYQLITGAAGTTFLLSIISHNFNSSTSASQRLVAQIGAAAGAADPYPISSFDTVSATGNQCKIYGNGGTFKNMAVFISSNTRDSAMVVFFNNNGVNQTMTVTVPAMTSGLFEDVVNSDAVVANDLVRWNETRGGTVGAVTVATIAVDFETTDNTFLVNSFGTTTVSAGAATFYKPIAGGDGTNSTTESEAQGLGLTQFTLTNFRVFVANNGITAASTVNVRKNGANSGMTVSITASTNGEFEDIVNSVSVIPTDLLNTQYIIGATGTNVNLRGHQLTATVAASDDNQYLPILGIGR